MYDTLMTVDEKDKEILKLKATILSLDMQNSILNTKYEGLRTKKELLENLISLVKDKSEKINNMYYYEEGKIEALLWVFGLPNNTKLEELEEILKNIKK